MPRKSELVEVSYRPAKGGIVSETRTRTRRSGQGGGPDYDHETEQGVHPTTQHAQAHLKELFAHIVDHLPEEEAEIRQEKESAED